MKNITNDRMPIKANAAHLIPRRLIYDAGFKERMRI
jgi:hypothetical protein